MNSETHADTVGLLRATFSFPNPVNEYAARTVAGMVAAVAIVTIALDVSWLLVVLVYGFAARVLTGPTLSPMARLATQVLVPLAGDRYKPVPGRPKRFAQAVGLVFTTTALILYSVAGSAVAAYAVLGVLVAFALLEAVLGFCAGCFVYGYLTRWGLMPPDVCETC